MREIKFRGKRIDNGKWVYGMPYSFKDFWDKPPYGKPYILMFNPEWDLEAQFNYLKDPIAFSHLEGAVWKVAPESIGQYIGLKDNPPDDTKRTEIYDRDIVRLYTCFEPEEPELNESTVHKVEYLLHLDYPGFDLVPDGDWECNGLGWAVADSECVGFKVIGNMTDSPKLFKLG